MNSESENNYSAQPRGGSSAPAQSALDKLKAASKTAVQTVRETPYQPIVYAIPKDDWEAFQKYFKETATFQPTLFEKIEPLATREELNADSDERWQYLTGWAEETEESFRKSTQEIVPKVRNLLSENRDLISQDGKMREKFLSDLEAKEQTRLEEFTEEVRVTKGYMIKALIGTILSSGLLSLVICLLMR